MIRFKQFLQLQEGLKAHQRAEVDEFVKDNPRNLKFSDHVFGDKDRVTFDHGGIHRGKKLKITVTRNAHDVAAMSTGRKWDSCLNYRSGENKGFIPGEIQHGTHIAYLHHEGDEKLKSPVARIALKPYHSNNGEGNHTVLHPEEGVYKSNTHTDNEHGFEGHLDDFKNKVHDWTKEKFPLKKKELYNINRSVYTDTEYDGRLFDKKDISYHLNSDKYSHRLAAILHPDATPSHIHKALDDTNEWVGQAAARHHNATDKNLMKAAKKYPLEVASNPKSGPKLLHHLLKHKDPAVRELAVTHPNADISHWEIAAEDSDFRTRTAAKTKLRRAKARKKLPNVK